MPANARKNPEVVGKVGVGTGDGFGIRQVFRLKTGAVGREDKLHLLPRRRWAIPQCRQRRAHLPLSTHLQMNIVALEDTAG